MIKKTKWYAGNQKPARPGVYERKTAAGLFWSFWDGAHWRHNTQVFAQAATGPTSRMPSGFQAIPWRGQVAQ